MYHGPEKANSEILGFVRRARRKIDSCVRSNAPSVIMEVDEIRKARITAVNGIGVKLRYVIDITRENIEHCRQMLAFSEVRHLDGMKGNFEIADEREFVAVSRLQKEKPIPELIVSDVPEIVEQQQFVFDTFWSKAVPAEQRMREIEEGVEPPVSIVYSDYREAERREYEMIRGSKREIQIIYSTAKAFHLQEKSGVLEILKEMSEQNPELKISILTPMESSIRKSMSLRLLKNAANSNILVQDVAPSINIKIKALVVDKMESLIVELRHTSEENADPEIGFSMYSNSQPAVLSYSSIFEVIYNQSVLYQQLRQEGSLKDEFINVAAHELRTPIMPIINGVEMLEEKLGERKKEYSQILDLLTRNASRLQNLAESILQVSKIESGSFSLSVQRGIDINNLVSKVVDDIEKKYMYTDKAKHVSISFHPFPGAEGSGDNDGGGDNGDGDGSGDARCDSEMPPSSSGKPTTTTTTHRHRPPTLQQDKNQGNNGNNAWSEDTGTTPIPRRKNTPPPSPLYAECDSERVRQVVVNLLDNAVKFTSRGKIVVSTSLTDSLAHPSNGKIHDGGEDESTHGGHDDDNSSHHSHSSIGSSSSSGYHNTDSRVEPGVEGNKTEGPPERIQQTWLTVSIKNEGKGFGRRPKGQIFEKFSSRSPQGIGLGLYLSRKIVEAHGGAIWFEEYDHAGENESDHNSSGYNSGSGSLADGKRKVTVVKFGIPVSLDERDGRWKEPNQQ